MRFPRSGKTRSWERERERYLSYVKRTSRILATKGLYPFSPCPSTFPCHLGRDYLPFLKFPATDSPVYYQRASTDYYNWNILPLPTSGNGFPIGSTKQLEIGVSQNDSSRIIAIWWRGWILWGGGGMHGDKIVSLWRYGKLTALSEMHPNLQSTIHNIWPCTLYICLSEVVYRSVADRST